MASNPADGRKVGWSSSRKYVIQPIPAICAEQQPGDGLLNLAYSKLSWQELDSVLSLVYPARNLGQNGTAVHPLCIELDLGSGHALSQLQRAHALFIPCSRGIIGLLQP